MANNYFNFKAFSIQQEGCAMKVCTDSCLFGAWVAEYIFRKEFPIKNLLDIGTGTGLLTLMLAQKTTADIIAIEINKTAAAVAKENILTAAFINNFQIIEEDILHFVSNESFEFIISNPPFYDSDLTSVDERINTARHSSGLTIEALAKQCASLSSDIGEVALLAPYKREKAFVESMLNEGFYLHKVCRVRHSAKKSFIRSILLFTKQRSLIEETEIVIKEEQNNYSPIFKNLLSDYYLDL